MARFKIKRFTDGSVVAIDTTDGSIKYGIDLAWIKVEKDDEIASFLETISTSLFAGAVPRVTQNSNPSNSGLTPPDCKHVSLQFYGTGGTLDGVAQEDGKVTEFSALGGLATISYLVPANPSKIDGTTRVVIAYTV